MILWHNGAPWEGVDVTNDPGTTLYWQDGAPFGVVFEASTTSNIKSFNKVLFDTNTKKIMGVLKANVKKLMGVTA